MIRSDSPVASRLEAGSAFEEADIKTIPPKSVNSSMAYALLALIGCCLNFALNIGVGVYCARNRKRT